MASAERLAAKRAYGRERQRRIRAADPEGTRSKQREYQRLWRAANVDEVRDRNLRHCYGIGTAEFDEMLAAQGGACAICGTTVWGGKHKTPHVDHDHATGRIRGILCHGCNTGLGSFGDSPERMRLAIRYLEVK